MRGEERGGRCSPNFAGKERVDLAIHIKLSKEGEGKKRKGAVIYAVWGKCWFRRGRRFFTEKKGELFVFLQHGGSVIKREGECNSIWGGGEKKKKGRRGGDFFLSMAFEKAPVTEF